MSFCPCGKEAADGSPLCDRCFALQVLELTPTATPTDVRAAYHMLVKVWHPDRFQSDAGLKQAANEKLKAINSAYLYLTSRSARAERDRQRQAAPPSSSAAPSAPRAAAPARHSVLGVRSLLATFATVGMLQRAALLLLGLTAGGVALKLMDTVLCSDPDTAHVYVAFRAAVLSQLDAPRHRFMSVLSDLFHRGGSQPSVAAATSDTATAPAPPPTGAAAHSSKRHVALTHLQSVITVGLTRDEVVAIAGPPTSTSDDKLVYGDSEIDLKEGVVIGWKLGPASPIHVKLWPTSEVDRTLRVFSVDSTKDDVLVVQGTPTLLAADKFGYGNSEIYFRNNRVVSWKNDPMSAPLRAVSR